MSTKRQRRPDWSAIQTEYEGSAAPLRVIASRHGVSHEGIRKRAKAEKWDRGAAKGIEMQPSAAEAPSPEVSAQVEPKPRGGRPKPRKRSPRRILEDIANSELAPAAARVAACKVLLGMDKPTAETKAAEAHDRVTRRALELIEGGRR